MTRRTILAVLVLLVILGLIYLVQNSKDKNDDKQVAKDVIFSATAFNQTKNQDAGVQPATKDDVIAYTLNIENPGDKVISGYIVECNIADLQELGTLLDADGANYNPTTGSLIWTPIDIPQDGSIQKKITVRVKHDLPLNSDLVMTLKFGNETTVAISRAAVAGETIPKGAGASPDGSTRGASVSYASPQTGPGSWVSLMLALFSTSGFYLYRFKRKLA